MAALSALVLSDIALVLPGLFGLGAGIALAISKDWRRMAPGLLAAVFGVLAILGTIGSVGGEGGGVEFGISVEMGVAFAIASCLMFPAAALALRWGNDDPEWLAFVQAAVVGLGVLLAFVFQGSLPDHAAATTLVVGILALGSLWPAILALRDS